jgi:hypothetical protein
VAKPNPLSQGLSQQLRQPPPLAPVVVPARVEPKAIKEAKPVPPSRAGRVLIGGHFAPEVQTELKVLAAQERTTVQQLVAEGINAVFARRHKPQIAELTPQSAGSA